jgi:hypothetical protein
LGPTVGMSQNLIQNAVGANCMISQYLIQEAVGAYHRHVPAFDSGQPQRPRARIPSLWARFKPTNSWMPRNTSQCFPSQPNTAIIHSYSGDLQHQHRCAHFQLSEQSRITRRETAFMRTHFAYSSASVYWKKVA